MFVAEILQAFVCETFLTSKGRSDTKGQHTCRCNCKLPFLIPTLAPPHAALADVRLCSRPVKHRLRSLVEVYDPRLLHSSPLCP